MHLLLATTVGFVVLTARGAMPAQMPGMPVPGGCDTPVKERTSEVGCYLLATEALGTLPQGPVFWHLYSYATRSAAEATRGPRGTVVESLGKIWLYTIAEQGWRPAGGERVAVIGPFATAIGKPYTARYMESALTPGMQSRTHRHSGPEAMYVVSGAQCVETPEAVTVTRAGEGVTLPEGSPMLLIGVGTETRRAVVLVLHDSSQPWITMASEWQAKGLCPK